MTQQRDMGQELLESIRAIKEGKGKRYTIDVPTDVLKTRQHLALSQAAFASFMGVSKRTLQEWEQKRKNPSGPARTLLRIAKKHPEIFVDL